MEFTKQRKPSNKKAKKPNPKQNKHTKENQTKNPNPRTNKQVKVSEMNLNI